MTKVTSQVQGNELLKEVGLQVATENWQRWYGRDMAWHSVLGMNNGDRRSSVAESCQP